MPSAFRTITRIQDADDANLTLTNGYMVVYDSGQGKFVTQAIPSASPGGSTGYVQYNNGGFAGHNGFVYDGAGKVTLSSALVVGAIRPASDSTAALQLQNAAGAPVITLNTTAPSATIAGDVTLNKNLSVSPYLRFLDLNSNELRYTLSGSTMTRLAYTTDANLTETFDVRPITGVGANGKTIEQLFKMANSSGSPATMASQLWTLLDATGISSSWGIKTAVAGTITQRLRLAGGLSLGSTYVSTDPGNGSMILSGSLGIGTTSPNSKLDVAGTVQMDGLRIDVTPTNETITCTHTITLSANGTNYKIPCAAA